MFSLLAHHIRPVWIASYPRSGNTFLRIILESCFRLPTYSKYYVEGQTHHDPSADALTEAPRLPRKWRRVLSDAPDAKMLLIKTHDLPEDNAQAIYIIRDGRAAIDSYFHYHKKFAFEQPSLTDVIAGACQFGGWSAHYRAWNPAQRPNTLFLRYEDLVARPTELIPQLADFLAVQPTGGKLPTFDELKAQSPAFFRRGANKDFLTEWTPGQMALFNRLHGPVMEQLGYSLVTAGEASDDVTVELAVSIAKLHAQYLQQLTNLAAASQETLLAEISRLEEELDALTDQAANQDLAFPLLQNRWVKLGVALGLVPSVRQKSPPASPAPHSASSSSAH